jgi:Uma2 family endonuclease
VSSSAQEFPSRHRLSATDYRRMGEVGILPPGARVELIDGEIIDMAPIGSRHSAVVLQMARLFQRAVGDAALVSVQSPIALGDLSAPQPDIALLAPRDDFYRNAHPAAKDILLVVEVADASLRYDREIKVPLYARHGITEVWLVDLENDELMRYGRGGPDQYRTASKVTELASVAPAALPTITVDLSGVFSR